MLTEAKSEASVNIRKQELNGENMVNNDQLSFKEGVVLLCIGSFGILGNAISIPYFGNRISRQKTFYTLLTCLSVCDLIVVITGMLLYGISKVSTEYYKATYYIIAPYIFPTFEIGSTGSIYITMAICIERYFVVCRPFWYHEQAIPSRAYTVPILLFSVIYNIPRFFEVRTTIQNGNFNTTNITDVTKSNELIELTNKSIQMTQDDTSDVVYGFEPTQMRQNVTYYGIYHIGCAIIFQFLIPLFVLVFGNLMILRQLIKNNRNSSAISNQTGVPRTTQLRMLRSCFAKSL